MAATSEKSSGTKKQCPGEPKTTQTMLMYCVCNDFFAFQLRFDTLFGCPFRTNTRVWIVKNRPNEIEHAAHVARSDDFSRARWNKRHQRATSAAPTALPREAAWYHIIRIIIHEVTLLTVIWMMGLKHRTSSPCDPTTDLTWMHWWCWYRWWHRCLVLRGPHATKMLTS